MRKNTLWIDCTVNCLMIKIVIVNMRVFSNCFCIHFTHFETLVQKWIIINFLFQCKLFQKLSSCTSGSTQHRNILYCLIYISSCRFSQNGIWWYCFVYMWCGLSLILHPCHISLMFCMKLSFPWRIISIIQIVIQMTLITLHHAIFMRNSCDFRNI